MEYRTVRFISDIIDLNKRILRQPYPMPKIQDLLLRLEGFPSGTILDLNMGYSPILNNYECSFHGNLGTWYVKPYDINLNQIQNHYGKHFPVPRIHELTFK